MNLTFWILWIILSVVFATLAITWMIWNSKEKTKSICILVLGDIGRSPRMQYHALSFADAGFRVDIVGHTGSKPLDALIGKTDDVVKFHYIPSTNVQNWPKLLGYIIKTLAQMFFLLKKFFFEIDCSYVMVQNPPAVPTLLVCWLYCRFTGAQFIIDWHNYAYTIMRLNLRPEHILVKATKFFESFFGSRADLNFCVSKAMKDDLATQWGIKAEVLYDKAHEDFRPISVQEKHELMTKLSKDYEAFRDENGSSIFTEIQNGDAVLLPKRPGFVVSSTSWTDDEDFSILFNALQEYEIACEGGKNNLPDLVCAVTGKGPLKEFWKAIVERKNWRHVKVVTPWLEDLCDYSKLIASADLGVCLHTSSSGLDLPMKVVDMFGCGIPVCAVNYNCLNELVRHGENGYVFSNESELASQLIKWFDDFPNNEKQRAIEKEFIEEIKKIRERGWEINWRSVVLPCFD